MVRPPQTPGWNPKSLPSLNSIRILLRYQPPQTSSKYIFAISLSSNVPVEASPVSDLKQAISDDMMTAHHLPYIKLDNFSKFSHLPTELRAIIWQFAVPIQNRLVDCPHSEESSALHTPSYSWFVKKLSYGRRHSTSDFGCTRKATIF